MGIYLCIAFVVGFRAPQSGMNVIWRCTSTHTRLAYSKQIRVHCMHARYTHILSGLHVSTYTCLGRTKLHCTYPGIQACIYGYGCNPDNALVFADKCIQYARLPHLPLFCFLVVPKMCIAPDWVYLSCTDII